MPKDKELEQAKFHLKKNNSEIAISILLQTIALKKAKSAHFEILGYVYGNLGDKKKCLHYLSMACEFSNATPEAHFYLGKELIQMDEYQSGIQHLHKSLSKAGNFFEALFELGIGYQKLKKFSESLDFFKKSIEINRDSVHALINIGKLYSEEFNDPQNGVKFFDQAITLNPNNYDAWIAKGVAYNLLEDNEQAVLCFLKATQINPELAIAWNNYGLVLMRLKKINEAIIAFTHAMRCEPSNVIFIINTANLYLQLKNYSIAIDLFLLTLRLDQNCAEAWIGRARCEFKTKKLSEAFISIDKAIQCDPNLSDGLFYKGCFYADLKKYKLAIQFFELALKANNSQSSLLGYLLEAKMSILDWGGIDKLFTDLSFKIMNGKASSNPLIFQAISNDPDQNLKCGEAFCSATFIRFSDYKITNEVKNKLRIAYISPDFKKHPVGHLTHEIYKFHDRSRFEVYGYFLDSYSDSLTDVISNNFDKKFDCWHLSDLQLVDLIRSHSIDIAVDLAGHTQNSRLNIFLNRIAPIQINFIGYPGTMGCAQFDYIIGDPILIPKSNK
jgi:predicted O-linked N-acetylglucosamine transferase (SPINDLY family)